MKLNKIGEVWNSANRLLSDFIDLLSSKNFATMATWRNDFSSLFVQISEKVAWNVLEGNNSTNVKEYRNILPVESVILG